MQMPSPSTADIRTWAQQNGPPVGDRGRLPAEILAAYDKAQRKSAPSVRPTSKAKPSARPASKATRPGRPASKSTPPAAKIAPIVVTTFDAPVPAKAPTAAPVLAKAPTAAPVVAKTPTAAPVVAKAPETDRLAARLVDVELRLSELTRRLTAIEASASPRRFGRRRT